MTQMNAALTAGARVINVAAATALGTIQGGAVDCVVNIPSGSSIAGWFMSTGFPNTGHNTSSRVRINGPGKLGWVSVFDSNDIIIDGVVCDPAGLGQSANGNIFNAGRNVRTAIVNCVGKITSTAGLNGFVGLFVDCFDTLFAQNNFINDVTSTTSAWIVRYNSEAGSASAGRCILLGNSWRTRNVFSCYRQGGGGSTGSAVDNTFGYQNTFISIDANASVLKDEVNPFITNHAYFDLTTFYHDGGLVTNFGGRPDQFPTSVSNFWRVQNSTWHRNDSSQINNTILQAIMDSGTAVGESLSYVTGNTFNDHPGGMAALVAAYVYPTRVCLANGLTVGSDPGAI
jgi:hypothetical protein